MPSPYFRPTPSDYQDSPSTAYVLFASALPPRVREAEVLIVATELKSPFEWQTHVHTAAAAGR